MVRTRKRFGQNFLIDEGVIDRIVSVVGLSGSDRVLEIGPGTGAITSRLHEIAKENYTAIEIDRDLVRLLSDRYPNLTILNEDVLQVNFDSLIVENEVRVIGNLPYNITSPLLFRLISTSARSKVQDFHFMVQKEMADRLAASPGSKSWGRLSIMIQTSFEVSRTFDVAPSAFRPQPKVWSSFIRMVPVENQLDDQKMTVLNGILRNAFSGRRKKIQNSLSSFDIDWRSLALDPSKRADQLTMEDYLQLTNSLTDEKR